MTTKHYAVLTMLGLGIMLQVTGCQTTSPSQAGSPAEVKYEEGRSAYNEKNYPQAITAYQEAVELKPDYVAAYVDMGFAYFDLYKFDEALDAFTSALAIEEGNLSAYYGLGLVARRQERISDAIASFRSVVDSEPTYHQAWLELGRSLFSARRYSESLEAYRSAIKVKPDFVEAFESMADTYRQMGHYVEGLETIQSAIKLNPNSSNAHLVLGRLYIALGRNDEAMAAFTKAIEMSSGLEQGHAYFWRAHLKHRIIDLNGAIEDYDQSIALQPEQFYPVLFSLAAMCERGDDLAPIQERARKHIASPNAAEWQRQLIAMFAGDLAEVDLLDSIRMDDQERANGQLCEALYHCAMLQVPKGNSRIFHDLLERCLTTGQDNYVEYMLAQTRLKQLEQYDWQHPFLAPPEWKEPESRPDNVAFKNGLYYTMDATILVTSENALMLKELSFFLIWRYNKNYTRDEFEKSYGKLFMAFHEYLQGGRLSLEGIPGILDGIAFGDEVYKFKQSFYVHNSVPSQLRGATLVMEISVDRVVKPDGETSVNPADRANAYKEMKIIFDQELEYMAENPAFKEK